MGNTIDLSAAPVSTNGEGSGTITVTQVGQPAGDTYTYDVSVSLPIAGTDTFIVEDVPLFGSIEVAMSITGTVEATDRFDLVLPPIPVLQAGDANQDLRFDQRDIVQVLAAAKYLSQQPATWGEGDWNGAPGGSPGSPPAGDGFFDQFDIIAAQQAGLYLSGPYAALETARTMASAAATAGVAAVPEPSALVLFAFGVLGLIRRFLKGHSTRR